MARRIESNPEICHGKPCFAGTRILVSAVLDSLAEGHTAIEVASEYPPLKTEDILEAIHYAAVLAKGEEFSIAT